jgi:hypothetical protein
MSAVIFKRDILSIIGMCERSLWYELGAKGNPREMPVRHHPITRRLCANRDELQTWMDREVTKSQERVNWGRPVAKNARRRSA